jgi:hypothetical protein
MACLSDEDTLQQFKAKINVHDSLDHEIRTRLVHDHAHSADHLRQLLYSTPDEDILGIIKSAITKRAHAGTLSPGGLKIICFAQGPGHLDRGRTVARLIREVGTGRAIPARFVHLAQLGSPYALRKPDGTIRPVITQNPLFQTLEKILLSHTRAYAEALFHGTQFGAGQPNGALLVTHGLRAYLEHEPRACALTADIGNGFCSVKTDVLLDELIRYPNLEPLVAYVTRFMLSPRELPYRDIQQGPRTIPLSNGLAQGACLSPLLFGIYTLDALTTIQSRHDGLGLAAYLDDLVLTADSWPKLESAANAVANALAPLGLALSPRKFQLMSHDMVIAGNIDRSPPTHASITVAGATLDTPRPGSHPLAVVLGTPIGGTAAVAEWVRSHWMMEREHMTKLEAATPSLHARYTLLKHCVLTRAHSLARYVPHNPPVLQALGSYDEQVLSPMADSLLAGQNSPLDPLARRQAGLSIRHGGFDLTPINDIMVPAILASRVALTLHKLALPPRWIPAVEALYTQPVPTGLAAAIQEFTAQCGPTVRDIDLGSHEGLCRLAEKQPRIQRALSAALKEARATSLHADLISARDVHERGSTAWLRLNAKLLALRLHTETESNHSGAALRMLPVRGLTQLTNPAFQLLASLRLAHHNNDLIPPELADKPCLCGTTASIAHLAQCIRHPHALVTRRHNLVNRIQAHTLARGHVGVEIEPRYLDAAGNLVGPDLVLSPDGNTRLATDLTIVNPYLLDFVQQSAESIAPDHALSVAEQEKLGKYAEGCDKNLHAKLYPQAMSISGVAGKNHGKLLQTLLKETMHLCGDDQANIPTNYSAPTLIHLLFQRVVTTSLNATAAGIISTADMLRNAPPRRQNESERGSFRAF